MENVKQTVKKPHALVRMLKYLKDNIQQLFGSLSFIQSALDSPGCRVVFPNIDCVSFGRKCRHQFRFVVVAIFF